MVQRGDKIRGRYVIIGPLGSGNNGRVFEAHDKKTSERVALKFQHPQAFEGTTGYRNWGKEFELEAELLEYFHDIPGTPHLVERGRFQHGHFIAMELVPGVTISKYAADGNRPMELDAALSIIGQLCVNLSMIHRLGYVHRDVKPDNMVIMDCGTVRILDLGTVVHVDWDHEEIDTRGTPGYAAPEQTQDGRITPSMDVFSLGCMLVQMLTLTLPYPENYLASPRRTKSAPRLSRFPALPSTITALAESMIAWDPAGRPADCAELLKHLTPLLPSPGSPRNPKIIGADPTAFFRLGQHLM